MADPVIPHDQESERIVLGAMLNSLDAVDTGMESVDEEDFYVPANIVIFRAISIIRESGSVPDISTVPYQLDKWGKLQDIGGRKYIIGLSESVVNDTSVNFHVKVLRDKRILRELQSISLEIRASTMDSDADAKECLEKAESKIFSIRDYGTKTKAVKVGDILSGVFDSMEKYQSDKSLAGIPTMISEIDERILGFSPGDFILIAGRPSSGKTSLAMQITEELGIARVPVFVFSLEMTKEMLAQRMVCGRAEISTHAYRSRKISGDGWARISRVGGIINDAEIYIDDSDSLSINELRARARRAKSQNNIALFIIDYLQLLKGPRSENRQQEVTAISKGLKGMAKELRTPVIALSQLSRAMESRGEEASPRLSDLRESGSLEQDADIVIFTHRKRDKKGLYLPDAELIIAKYRNGMPETVEMTYVAKQTRFRSKAYNEPPEDYTVKD